MATEYIAQQVEEIVGNAETKWQRRAADSSLADDERETAMEVAAAIAALNNRLGRLSWCDCKTEVLS